METGSIIDFYDDPQGAVLKDKIPNPEDVPDFIKTASFLGPEDRAKLPDDVFALVAVDNGRAMRKYACTDQGNTALSVIYLLENGHRLPEEAQKTAAANLVTACGWYDMEPPLALLEKAGMEMEKAALSAALLRRAAKKAEKLKRMTTNPVTRERRALQALKFRLAAGRKAPWRVEAGTSSLKGLAEAAKAERGRVHKSRMLFTSDPKGRREASKAQQIFKYLTKEKTGGLLGAALGAAYTADVAKRGMQRHKKMTSGPAMKAVKIGDASGTDTMPYQSDPDEGLGKTAGWTLPSVKGPAAKQATKRLADVLAGITKKNSALQPYVDVTGQSAPVKLAQVRHERYALVKEGQGRFPIDSYGDVEKAAAWFDNYWSSLHPEDRREFCVKLAARADELAIPVSDTIKKYGGADFAPNGEIKVAVRTRMQFWREGDAERSLLEGLEAEGTKAGFEKTASGMTPEVFCEALRQFDEQTGLNHYWDSGIYDPWFSTYGIQKEAEWKFVHKSDKINEDQLNAVVSGSYKWLTERFGQEFADALRKNPRQIFDSLPLPQKVIIMQLANDPQPRYSH